MGTQSTWDNTSAKVRGREVTVITKTNNTIKMKTFFAAVMVSCLLAIAFSAPNPAADPEAKPEESEFGENDNVQVQQLNLGSRAAKGEDLEINQAMLEGCGCSSCPCQ